MTPLRQHMIDALQLRGKGKRTQEAYVREVRLLSEFYSRSPARISEPELQKYFLHRKTVDHLAPNSMRMCYRGIRFFSQHVHRGKGAKDRYVPLPPDTLELLRHYWATHRNPIWLFPATGRDQKHSATATEPMSRHSVQGAFRKAQQRAGMNKVGVALPTLRHAYAPPLLEASVTLRLIQLSLGHTRRATPMLSLHLTQKGHDDADERINSVRRGLPS